MVSGEDGQKVRAVRLKSKTMKTLKHEYYKMGKHSTNTAKTHQDLRAALGFPLSHPSHYPTINTTKNLCNTRYNATHIVGVIQIAA
jgi:hypothetical protein